MNHDLGNIAPLFGHLAALEVDAPAAVASGWWWGVMAPALIWYVAHLVLSLGAWALLHAELKRSPGGGWLMARLLGLLIPAYLAWLARSIYAPGAEVVLGPLKFGGAALLFLVLAGIAAIRAWSALQKTWEQHCPTLLKLEAGFLIVFLLLIAIRSQTPEITYEIADHAGEKFTDFALFQASRYADSFPPEHPWFSGIALNYYYLSHHVWSYHTQLTGLPSAMGYNLALCTVFALLWLGAAGMFLLLGFKLRFALPGGVLVLIAGPISTWLKWLASEQATGSFLRTYYFWGDTRLINDHITEIPWFSFLLGDLHAHVTGLVILLYIIILALSFVQHRPRHAFTFSLDGRRPDRTSGWTTLLLLGFMVGCLSAINTWDVITLGVAWLLCCLMLLRFGKDSSAFALRYLFSFPPVIILGVGVFFLPFWLGFQPPATEPDLQRLPKVTLALYDYVDELETYIEDKANASVLDNLKYKVLSPMVGALSRWHVVPPALRSPFDSFLEFWGLLLIPIIGALKYTIWMGWGKLPRLNYSERNWRVVTWMLGGLSVGVLFALWLRRLDADALEQRPAFAAATGLLLLVLPFLVRPRPTAPTEWIVHALIAIVGALILITETIYINDVFVGDNERLNTVFKLLYPAWLFLSLATIACVVVCIRKGNRFIALTAQRYPIPAYIHLFIICFVGVLLCGYALAATVSRISTTNPYVEPLPSSLHGWQFALQPNHPYYDDYRAILYLEHGLAHEEYRLMEGHAGTYTVGSRFSSNLGKPSWLGWDQHVASWSGNKLYEDTQTRRVLVQAFYTTMTPDERRELLELADINMIVFGQLEAELYGEENFTALRDSFNGWAQLDIGKCILIIYPDLADKL
jgi:YYY domain-containing protein